MNLLHRDRRCGVPVDTAPAIARSSGKLRKDALRGATAASRLQAAGYEWDVIDSPAGHVTFAAGTHIQHGGVNTLRGQHAGRVGLRPDRQGLLSVPPHRLAAGALRGERREPRSRSPTPMRIGSCSPTCSSHTCPSCGMPTARRGLRPSTGPQHEAADRRRSRRWGSVSPTTRSRDEGGAGHVLNRKLLAMVDQIVAQRSPGAVDRPLRRPRLALQPRRCGRPSGTATSPPPGRPATRSLFGVRPEADRHPPDAAPGLRHRLRGTLSDAA